MEREEKYEHGEISGREEEDNLCTYVYVEQVTSSFGTKTETKGAGE